MKGRKQGRRREEGEEKAHRRSELLLEGWLRRVGSPSPPLEPGGAVGTLAPWHQISEHSLLRSPPWPLGSEYWEEAIIN